MRGRWVSRVERVHEGEKCKWKGKAGLNNEGVKYWNRENLKLLLWAPPGLMSGLS